MSAASVSELDISAALDELLKDDEVFQELSDLPLHDGVSFTTVPCTAQELDSFDLSFLFPDVCETPEGVWSTQSHDLDAASCSPIAPGNGSVWNSQQLHTSLADAHQQMEAIAFEVALESNDCFNSSSSAEVLELCKGETTPTTVSPGPSGAGELQADSCTAEFGNESATIATLQACVQHDHPYARTAASLDSVMLEGERMEVEGGSDSGSVEEGSTYDAGLWRHPSFTSKPTLLLLQATRPCPPLLHLLPARGTVIPHFSSPPPHHSPSSLTQ